MVPDLQTRLAIFNEWQSGNTQKQLAKKYGFSESRINQICGDVKIKLHSAKRKTHFINPATSQQACSVAVDSLHLQLTSDINQVTCGHCLNSVAGKKHAGGKPRHGTEPKVSINLKIDKDLKQKAVEKKLNCSKLLEDAIKGVE